MSELRQNIATKEWVIIAPERSNRPDDFISRDRRPLPEVPYSDRCPFCAGNEAQTGDEVMAVRDGDGRWLVRVVPNKYPALTSDGELDYREQGTQRRINGLGHHLVIVEAPQHNTTPALMEAAQVERVLGVYQQLYLQAIGDPRVELVTLFKNHGQRAGMSQQHPHSQLIATPVVPANVRQRVELAIRYYDDHRTCVYCTMLAEELRSGERVVAESQHFAAFVLYAALSPFHIWILPKRHQAAFVHISDEERADLARLLRQVLRKIFYGLENPDYNFVIRSRDGQPRAVSYFHWYLSLVPRVSTTAGFELASGMYINTLLPERAAEFLRQVEA
ncbi:MAG: galactose-1-phosphate uridylyltransferase [Deltaproteobacteria bacterium]|nr:galactose-1-phosphate uridylyltransferase [Deltaproteobacteria bacterium]